MKKVVTMGFTKTDKRILIQKLDKLFLITSKSIDNVMNYPANRIPARTRDKVVRKLTRTIKAIAKLMEDLEGGELS